MDTRHKGVSLVVGLLAASCGWAAALQQPTGLLCELSAEPLGIEDFTPAFSWIVNDPQLDAVQTAYQIQVHHGLGSNRSLVWDSRKTASSRSIAVPYRGAQLQPGQIYTWTVRTWNGDDEAGPYAEPQLFVTGLKDTWSSRPIWGSADWTFVYLRQTIRLSDKPIEKALAFVSGRDTEPARQYVYKFYVNETAIGLGPARSYGDKVPYNVFDITEPLQAGGKNVLGAICFSSGRAKAFIAEVKVFYKDGTVETFGTDERWRAKNADPYYNMGPKFFWYYQAGPEHIDARNEPKGWLTVEYEDSDWNIVRVLPRAAEQLFAQPTRPVQMHEVRPVLMHKKAEGHYFFDFGKEIVGCVRLAVVGTEGRQIEVRLGEELAGEKTVRHKARTGVTYAEKWTLRQGSQVIENFGYRGFRYGELLHMPTDEFTLSAVVLQYPFDDQAAAFDSADATLNEVWALCHYSIKATNIDLYQDCPTRERGPYEGDAYINMLSHYAADREYAFARYTNEYLYHRPTWPTEYKQTCLLMAWADYMATGDAKSLRRCYDILQTKTLSRFINAEGLVEKHDSDNDRVLVDWPASYRDGYEFTPINTVTNAFHYKAVQLLAQIAEELGCTEDARRYAAEAKKVKTAINTCLLDAHSGIYRDGRDSAHSAAHANFFPLALTVTPADKRKLVADFLVDKGMVCSVYGAQFLLEALYNADRDGAALALMTSTEMHSWYHMIHRLGATITTEAWDPSGKPNMSYAHPWATAPLNIIPRRLFGIEPLEPGYGKIRIRPQTGGLEWAVIKLPTIRGTIQAAFRDRADCFELDITLPATMTAVVYLPIPKNSDRPCVLMNGTPAEAVQSDRWWVIEAVGSGSRRFESR
jgi:alpha-L-rhamnosidase